MDGLLENEPVGMVVHRGDVSMFDGSRIFVGMADGDIETGAASTLNGVRYALFRFPDGTSSVRVLGDDGSVVEMELGRLIGEPAVAIPVRPNRNYTLLAATPRIGHAGANAPDVLQQFYIYDVERLRNMLRQRRDRNGDTTGHEHQQQQPQDDSFRSADRHPRQREPPTPVPFGEVTKRGRGKPSPSSITAATACPAYPPPPPEYHHEHQRRLSLLQQQQQQQEQEQDRYASGTPHQAMPLPPTGSQHDDGGTEDDDPSGAISHDHLLTHPRQIASTSMTAVSRHRRRRVEAHATTEADALGFTDDPFSDASSLASDVVPRRPTQLGSHRGDGSGLASLPENTKTSRMHSLQRERCAPPIPPPPPGPFLDHSDDDARW